MLRYLLKKEKKEINLSNIWDNQALSDSLTKEINDLASFVKSNIDKQEFRVIGSKEVTNAGEWCKMEACWQKFQESSYSLKHTKDTDTLNENQVKEKKDIDGQSSEASQAIESIEELLLIPEEKWLALIEFQKESGFSNDEKEISLPNAAIAMLKPPHKLISDAQQKALHKIYIKAVDEGFFYKAK